ncbi:DUF3098 domain-containing protein [Sphingobacterium sp. DK4209]|uniref:DUF3098 domain-containing protein n=1 Tax=Sphingobacterium zhuxiongii TaxID=2662364 RepID=A0A5Q0QB71_9SPHI|nr:MULTISPECIES: DUF3098 domain-containing protein [unclassified Sphingobacterium]MVZ66093.1 DUF3098 domain-containing protein [Sphingobacterium sp. DK4209]QGA26514.1 DUF3098 domain-containing protein [Sphingobacterium sp. dk4302]
MSQTVKKKTDATATKGQFAFQKINYQLFILAIVVVAIGFIIMMGTEDIYSFTKITLAPLVVVLGFALGFVAILYKPKNNKAD